VEKEEAEVISRLNEIEQRMQQESREYDAIAQDITGLQDDIRTTRNRMQAMEQKSGQQEQVVQKRIKIFNAFRQNIEEHYEIFKIKKDILYQRG
jgi:septal ring factor EnvC (AmiA/AmiB activator)